MSVHQMAFIQAEGGFSDRLWDIGWLYKNLMMLANQVVLVDMVAPCSDDDTCEEQGSDLGAVALFKVL